MENVFYSTFRLKDIVRTAYYSYFKFSFIKYHKNGQNLHPTMHCGQPSIESVFHINDVVTLYFTVSLLHVLTSKLGIIT